MTEFTFIMFYRLYLQAVICPFLYFFQTVMVTEMSHITPVMLEYFVKKNPHNFFNLHAP